jgi:chromate transport protein ChrA
VLSLAAFVGYHVNGILGAVAATVAVFTVPVALSAAAAQMVARLNASERFCAFGRFAIAASVGLLGLTLLSLGRSLCDLQPALLLGAVAVLAAELCQVSPVLLIFAAALIGGVVAG